ncbi:hypothetical protein ACFP63_10525 [Oerskovia jenensis]|uniref:Leucine-rich repeat domain-containing protein n=1 Tax=Oerskovia jenensis TaxID=162169 RepID=A0ABS2LJA3_9CELL|nr:hypothetical protein [Oerskovia jenensis]MBM7480496.1 hypothetical protein [Oerskovia jenensis]
MTSSIDRHGETAWWESPDVLVLDRARLDLSDTSWMARARTIDSRWTRAPKGLYAALPRLERLRIIDGATPDLDELQGCRRLRGLEVQGVRRLVDLSAVAGLVSLEALSLYGLKDLRVVPSLARLTRLSWVDLGRLPSLEGIEGLLAAPHLTDLSFVRAVGVTPGDATRIAASSVERFEWFAEDVPDREWVPFRAAVGLPRLSPTTMDGWFAARDLPSSPAAPETHRHQA